MSKCKQRTREHNSSLPERTATARLQASKVSSTLDTQHLTCYLCCGLNDPIYVLTHRAPAQKATQQHELLEHPQHQPPPPDLQREQRCRRSAALPWRSSGTGLHFIRGAGCLWGVDISETACSLEKEPSLSLRVQAPQYGSLPTDVTRHTNANSHESRNASHHKYF
jgi:hypothetical protein